MKDLHAHQVRYDQQVHSRRLRSAHMRSNSALASQCPCLCPDTGCSFDCTSTRHTLTEMQSARTCVGILISPVLSFSNLISRR